MLPFFEWLDAEPLRYWTLAWGLFSVTALLAFRAPAQEGTTGWRKWIGHPLVFASLVLLVLCAFRWPTWFVAEEFNPDESQMLAGAITLKQYLLYWKYVDGGTHGPVCEYLLVFASWLGAPLTHATARVGATGLQALALIASWRTLRSLTTERVARLGVLPGLAFWSFISWVDLVHYATELPAIALVSLAAWAVTRPLVAPAIGRPGLVRLFLGGLALGLIPLTKLQLIPWGASLALIAATLLWTKLWRDNPAQLRRSLGWFVAGGLLPALLLYIYLWTFGLVTQFWYSYVVSALDYSALGHHPLGEMGSWFFRFSATAFGFAWFFWGSLAFSLLFARSPCPPPIRLARQVAWALLAVAMFCVLRPSREVVHYLHILIIPSTLLAGLILAGALAEPAPTKLARLWPLVAFSGLTLLPQIHFRVTTGNLYLGSLPASLAKPRSAAAEYIQQHRQPGDTLAMWGWAPALFVETGLAQGTREACSAFLLSHWSLQEFYLDRFRRDMLNRRPAWFVDAVGPGAFVYEDRRTYGHEQIAPIRDLIARNYDLAVETGAQRIYRIKSPSPAVNAPTR